MKRIKVFTKLSLPLLICLGLIGAAGSSTEARSRCKDKCKDVYRLKRDACKAIPFKHERHSCERAAKHSKKECERKCR